MQSFITCNLRLNRKYRVKMFFLALLVIFNLKTTRAQTTANMILLDSVYVYMLAQSIKHPDIVLRQIIVETGWLKSAFLMKKNNLFGFSTNAGYMSFPTWKSSVEYYKRWQTKYYLNDKEDYYNFLVRIKYASAETYVEYLKKIQLPDKYVKKKGIF